MQKQYVYLCPINHPLYLYLKFTLFEITVSFIKEFGFINNKIIIRNYNNIICIFSSFFLSKKIKLLKETLLANKIFFFILSEYVYVYTLIYSYFDCT